MVWQPSMNRMTQALVCTILILLLSVQLTSSAAVDLDRRRFNLTMLGSYDHHCTDSLEWIGTGAHVDDCVAAIRLLHDSDRRIYGDLDVEFYAFPKTRAKSTLSRALPIKYTYGK